MQTRADRIDAAAAAALQPAFDAQREAFASQPCPSAAERRAWLRTLERLLLEHEATLCAAISQDFGHRPATETRLLELFPSLESIRHARRHVSRWMRSERRDVSVWFKPARASVHYQPLGVAGIVVPWNYPLYLAIGPLVGALAAGNRAMVKLSEHSPAFGQAFADLIAQRFPSDLIHVALGHTEVAKAFVQLPFDHLLFTGSSAVAHDVMLSAAQHLTPMTLELGGKSPALVAPDADLGSAARRIAFGKLVNAGQTCIAPDYVLAPRASIPALVEQLRTAAQRMYGTAASVDYASIATDRHFARLTGILDEACSLGARAVPLLDLPATSLPRRMAPVVLLDAAPTLRVMWEEIFGPILPIVGYDDMDAAVDYINAMPRPLALYLFDTDRRRRDAVLCRTASGGVTIGDTLLHVGQADLPFGGVGDSGMGRYHGIEGFRTFSQTRSVLEQSRFAMTALMYPPYGGALATRVLNRMLRR